MNNYDEQVYDCYYDTAGNYHWTGVYSGKHIERGGRMSRYIDADKFKEWYAKNIIHDDAFDRLVDMQPTADVRENVYGEWIKYGNKYKCNKCFATMQVNPINPQLKDRFCYFCGADMRREETNG